MFTQGPPTSTTGTTTTTQASSTTYPGWLPIKTLTYVLMGVWTPTFLTWMAVVFFDSMAMRDLMHQALHISMAGPYFLYWVGLGDYIMNADRSPMWYVVFGVVGLWSIASIAYQAIFVPKVTRWLQEAPLKDYPDPSILSGPEEVVNEEEITYVDPNPNVVITKPDDPVLYPPRNTTTTETDPSNSAITSGSATNGNSTSSGATLYAFAF